MKYLVMPFRKNLFLILFMLCWFQSFSQNILKGATVNILCNYKFDRNLNEWKLIDKCFKVNYEVQFLDKEIDVYDKETGDYNQILTNKRTPVKSVANKLIYYEGLTDVMRKNSKVDVFVSYAPNTKNYIDFTYIEVDFKLRIYLTDIYFYK